VQNLPQLIAQAEQRGKQRALQNMAAVSAASPMALGGGQTDRAADYGAMNDEAFDRLVKRALRGQLRGSNSL